MTDEEDEVLVRGDLAHTTLEEARAYIPGGEEMALTELQRYVFAQFIETKRHEYDHEPGEILDE